MFIMLLYCLKKIVVETRSYSFESLILNIKKVQSLNFVEEKRTMGGGKQLVCSQGRARTQNLELGN